MTEHKYIAVCAARNEEKFIHHSINSVLNQSIPPEICVLSDDGSDDDTPIIAEKLGAKVFYNGIKRFNMGAINQVLALNHGVLRATMKHPEWEFLLKFDADVKLPSTYVEQIIAVMEEKPRLGICSGQPDNEKLRLARESDAAKIYRRQCWDDINGLDIWVAFDSHAILKAAQAGWSSETINTIPFKELRPSGKYSLKRWIITGFERASFGFPLYHTILASTKNVKWASPPILNVIATIFSHILNPWPKDPNLDQKWVRDEYAVNEIRFYINRITGNRLLHEPIPTAESMSHNPSKDGADNMTNADTEGKS